MKNTRTEHKDLRTFLKKQGGNCSATYTSISKTFYRVKLWDISSTAKIKKKVIEDYALSLGAYEVSWGKGCCCCGSESFIAKFPK